MPTAATLLKKKKIQQRIHREELKLARLLNQVNKKRREDTRLKLRLGGLIFLVGWEDIGDKLLTERILELSKNLDDANADETESYKILGENTLRILNRDREYEPTPARLSDDEKRLLNHQKISIGGILVKYKLHETNRAVLFGALLDLNKRFAGNKKAEPKITKSRYQKKKPRASSSTTKRRKSPRPKTKK